MLFNSGHFLLFFPVVTALYFLFPHRFRWAFLLAASYYFYMAWKVEYIVLIMGSTVVDYVAAQQIHRQTEQNIRRRWLYLSIFVNLGILFSFKYFNFFNESIHSLAQFAGLNYPLPILEVLLPVGISFYTFQTMSYTLDVYHGKTQPEKHFGIFALFVSFWPQLVAGPIERSNRLLPQFRKVFQFDYERVVHGLTRMAYGFFKKVVVADRMAVYVNEVFGDVESYTTIPLILAVIFFSIQIYCDFSGYTDIALGAAQVMGFTLMENFDRPYLSASIREFWKRWHISLSTWFKDYVYIPLGGNRRVKWRWYYNLFITFLVSGLWHGANWTFVIWGALHGLYLVWAIIMKTPRARLKKFLGLDRAPKLDRLQAVLITYVLVLIGWVFFRAENLEQALLIFENIAAFDISLNFTQIFAENGPYNFLLSLMAIGLLVLSYLLPKNMNVRHKLVFVVSAILVIILFGKGDLNEFIYFQF